MARVVSIHEYQLKPDADRIAFERAFRNAEERGLFDLPGLIEHYFLKGLKGAQQAGYGSIWIYESQEAWEMLWGPLECPVQPPEYPEKWKIWENEILAPFLTQHPDRIRFTSYEELGFAEHTAHCDSPEQSKLPAQELSDALAYR